MHYATRFLVPAEPAEVFAAIHRYKHERNPGAYFLGPLFSRVVHMGFQVVSPNAVGLGATYDWRITLFGLSVLQFREQVVEWVPARAVGYQAVRGWNMTFRTELEPAGEGTLVCISIDCSTGFALLDRIAKPVVEIGLRLVSGGMIRRGLARGHRNEASKRA